MFYLTPLEAYDFGNKHKQASKQANQNSVRVKIEEESATVLCTVAK